MVIKKKSAAAETAGAGNYITVYAEENFKGNSERFEVRSNSIFPFLLSPADALFQPPAF